MYRRQANQVHSIYVILSHINTTARQKMRVVYVMFVEFRYLELYLLHCNNQVTIVIMDRYVQRHCEVSL